MSKAVAMNVMRKPQIIKVTINIGVGEGGERLLAAEKVLRLITGLEPVRTIAKITNRELKVREGAPIGCKVTMRKQDQIQALLKDLFWIKQGALPAYNFDAQGNLSVGIRDYTDFPDQKYDPDIGIFGMDINVVLERPGHRVSRRRRRKAKVGHSHLVSQSESQGWFAEQFGLKIVEE